LGFGSPALGLVAGWHGLGAVFLASTVAVLAGAVIAAFLLRASTALDPTDERWCPAKLH